MDALPPTATTEALTAAANLASRTWTVDVASTSADPVELRLLVLTGQEPRAIWLSETQRDPELAIQNAISIMEAVSEQSGAIDDQNLLRITRAVRQLANPWCRVESYADIALILARLDRDAEAERMIAGCQSASNRNPGSACKRAPFECSSFAAELIELKFLGSAQRRFFIPAYNCGCAARSGGQRWPKATTEWRGAALTAVSTARSLALGMRAGRRQARFLKRQLSLPVSTISQ